MCCRTESLLAQSMAALQGPALVAFNDASFSESDYRALARVGQAAKVERLAATGRFGLGFSAAYHLTDAPCLLSGSHLVVLDPHCCFAPGASVGQPGLVIA